MELNIKFDEKMIVETANKVLDEYEYNGKTIRELADLIANPKTNADRIRSMADEEMAKLFDSWVSDCACNNFPCQKNCSLRNFNCEKSWLKWLREECKSED